MQSLIIGIRSLPGIYLSKFLAKHGYSHAGTQLPGTVCEMSDSTIPIDPVDLLNLESIVPVLVKYKPDYIFNFAAQSSVDYAWKNPGDTVELNINGTLNLFEAIRIARINPVVILIGAGEEYGRVDFHNLPAKETVTLIPGNIYAVTKACQSMMAQIYYKAYGLRLIVARTFNIIGPGQSEQFAVSNFCRQAVCMEKGLTEPIFKIGNPNIQRDFTDIRDVVRAYWMLAQKGTAGEVYNVGSGRVVSIHQVLSCLRNQLPFATQLYVDKTRIRPVDTPMLVGDIGKLKRDVEWEVEFSLEDSIGDMLDFWREKLR